MVGAAGSGTVTVGARLRLLGLGVLCGCDRLCSGLAGLRQSRLGLAGPWPSGSSAAVSQRCVLPGPLENAGEG
jgi:hypothetical protein